MHKKPRAGNGGKKLKETPDQFIIKIKVEPRSAQPGFAGAYGDSLKVKLSSPPVEGRANKELIEILSREFRISKSNIEILSGQNSKIKTVKLIGTEHAEKTLKKLLLS